MVLTPMPEADPPVPQRFRPLRRLGAGGSAVTWLAHYEVTGQEVALKVWRSRLHDAADRERFVNECHWHHLLHPHPNIVGWVWASDPDDPHPWTATAPHGRSLAQLLRDGELPLPQAFTLAGDLLDGLSVLHRRGLVHRDVTPGNFLVAGGRGALCDFGLVLPLDRATVDSRAGTPGFVAPELADGSTPGYQTDVYAAAQTISRMIGDRAPVAIDHLVHAVAGSSRPQDRPVDAMAFARDLREAVAASGFSAPQPPAFAVTGPPRRHTRPGLIALAGAVAALAAAAGYLAWHATTAAHARPGWTAAGGFLAADIDAAGSPITTTPRAFGKCAGTDRPRFALNDRDGHALAFVAITIEADGRACAKLIKDSAGPLYDKPSQLALSLCNDRGECDHDWYPYRVSAGPVRVSAGTGCLHWRASIRDAAGLEWPVRDLAQDSGCGTP